MDIDLKQIRELMRAMKQLGMSELEIEANEQRIYLRRGAEPTTGIGLTPTLAQAAATSMPPPASLAPAASAAPPAEDYDDANVAYITSPFVGTFYRSPSPDSPPFIEVGSKISQGTVLCIVEAMKLMNEIESEIAGEILEVLVENGKPVEFGDKLFRVKTSG